MKVRIESTGRPVAATSNKRSHQQETTYRRWQRSKRSARNFVADPQEAPEACHRMWQVHTVLFLEQVRRGAWFLHDLSGNALQLSLPCMIRLECRHDVIHALGNARDRRDGERVSFLTNRRVKGSKRREDLDSEICEGLRQQFGDVGTHLP